MTIDYALTTTKVHLIAGFHLQTGNIYIRQ